MTRTFRDRLADYFKACPGQWIDGKQLALMGGGYAWRSRVSDCRTQLGMEIQNRVRWVKVDGYEPYKVSEYRYVPEAVAMVGGLFAEAKVSYGNAGESAV